MERTALIAGLVILFTAGPAGAAIYRYTDANGVVHYTDKPPSDSAQPITVRTTTPAPDPEVAARRTRAAAVSSALDDEARIDADTKAKAEHRKKALARECARARDNLANFRNAGGVYTLDKNGDRVFMDAATRSAREREMQDAIAHHCR